MLLTAGVESMWSQEPVASSMSPMRVPGPKDRRHLLLFQVIGRKLDQKRSIQDSNLCPSGCQCACGSLVCYTSMPTLLVSSIVLSHVSEIKKSVLWFFFQDGVLDLLTLDEYNYNLFLGFIIIIFKGLVTCLFSYLFLFKAMRGCLIHSPFIFTKQAREHWSYHSWPW